MAKEKKTKKVEKPVEQDSAVMPDIDHVSEEELETARKELRTQMREKFSKWIEVSDETVGDDFLQEAKADFQNEVDKYEGKKYLMATHEDGKALATAEFLKLFNDKYNKWQNGAWRGMLMFDKVITKHVGELSLDPEKDFEIDYSTLIFLYHSMSEPSGVGLESAREMAALENYNEETDKANEDGKVTYNAVYKVVSDYVRELYVVDQMLKLYRERVNLAAAGVRFDFKITELEEFKQFHDAWATDNIPGDPAELNKIANA